jgi:hypothetical protein
MKLFILETYIGDRWAPISFYTGTYYEAVEAGKAHYTAASRLRRVRSREAYMELEAYMATHMVPVSEEFKGVRTGGFPSNTLEDIEWLE